MVFRIVAGVVTGVAAGVVARVVAGGDEVYLLTPKFGKESDPWVQLGEESV
jgi:hypothetical protein